MKDYKIKLKKSPKSSSKGKEWKMERSDKKIRRAALKGQYLNNKNLGKRAERKSEREKNIKEKFQDAPELNINFQMV